METIKYLYITKRQLGGGEICVEGRRADGSLVFGYKEASSFFWQDKARRYTPLPYIPVFQANKPAEIKT